MAEVSDETVECRRRVIARLVSECMNERMGRDEGYTEGEGVLYRSIT